MSAGLINAALRIVTLGSRFLLSLYLAKFLSIHDVGVFALLTGLVGLLPALTGAGLNYFVSRAIVAETTHTAIRMSRDRLLFSIVASAVVGAVIAGLSVAGIVDLPIHPALLVGIVVLEVTGFDTQMMLLARRKSAFANLLLFLRAGGWVVPYIVASFALPALRTIEVVAIFWLAGLIASNLILFARYRSILPMLTTRTADAWETLVPSLRKAPKIYLADIGLAGSIYLDRFVVSSIISVEAAGIYFFYTSIINAVFVICLASTTQVYAPDLRSAYTTGGLPGLRDMLGDRMRKTILLSFLMLALALPATYLVAHIVGRPQLLANTIVIPIIVAAFAAKIVSEFLSTVIAAAERDTEYAAFNIAGLVLTVGFCAIGTTALGLPGTALGLLLSSCLIAALRFVAWHRLHATSSAHPVELL